MDLDLQYEDLDLDLDSGGKDLDLDLDLTTSLLTDVEEPHLLLIFTRFMCISSQSTLDQFTVFMKQQQSCVTVVFT